MVPNFLGIEDFHHALRKSHQGLFQNPLLTFWMPPEQPWPPPLLPKMNTNKSKEGYLIHYDSRKGQSRVS